MQKKKQIRLAKGKRIPGAVATDTPPKKTKRSLVYIPTDGENEIEPNPSNPSSHGFFKKNRLTVLSNSPNGAPPQDTPTASTSRKKSTATAAKPSSHMSLPLVAKSTDPSQPTPTSLPEMNQESQFSHGALHAFHSIVKENGKSIEKRFANMESVIEDRVVSAMEEFEKHFAELAHSVSELSQGITVLAAGSGIGKTQNSRNLGRKDLRDEVQLSHPFIRAKLKLIFSLEVVTTVAIRLIPLYFEGICSGNDTLGTMAKGLAVVMFGLQKDMTKAEFNSGIGLAHGNFRLIFVRHCFSHVRAVPNSLVKAEEHDSQLHAPAHGSVRSPQQPNSNSGSGAGASEIWLHRAYINKTSLAVAREQAEKPQHK